MYIFKEIHQFVIIYGKIHVHTRKHTDTCAYAHKHMCTPPPPTHTHTFIHSTHIRVTNTDKTSSTIASLSHNQKGISSGYTLQLDYNQIKALNEKYMYRFKISEGHENRKRVGDPWALLDNQHMILNLCSPRSH